MSATSNGKGLGLGNQTEAKPRKVRPRAKVEVDPALDPAVTEFSSRRCPRVDGGRAMEVEKRKTRLACGWNST